LAYAGGAALAVAAGDRISKRFAGPGVAAEGLPGRAHAEETRQVADSSQTGQPSAADPEVAGGGRKRIVIYGAGGGTGLALVQAALQRGYLVRAFVRNASRFARELGATSAHGGLEVVEGDLAADLEAVEAAVVGAEAVISVAGAKPETAPAPMAAAMPAIVAGCRKHGVRKLVVQACALSAVPGERWGWLTQGRLTRAIVRWQLGSTVVDDNERVIQYLHRDVRDLNWVVSRPAFLEDGDRTGTPVPCLDPFRSAAIAYVDLADWTLAQVDSDEYVGKMPRLYYAPVESPL